MPPEYTRLPRTGQHCPWCGLGRSQLNTLLREGKIRSISLRKPGHTRGTRLIVLESVLRYIRSFDTAQSPAVANGRRKLK